MSKSTPMCLSDDEDILDRRRTDDLLISEIRERLARLEIQVHPITDLYKKVEEIFRVLSDIAHINSRVIEQEIRIKELSSKLEALKDEYIEQRTTLNSLYKFFWYLFVPLLLSGASALVWIFWNIVSK